MKISVEKLFDGSRILNNQQITVTNGTIESITDCERDENIESGLLIPGLVDLQVNGGDGILFNQNPSVETLKRIDDSLLKQGTTSWLPTFITDDYSKMLQAANAVSEFMEAGNNGVKGIHFEGPHISKVKKGIHPEEFIRPLSSKEMNIYCRKNLGTVMLTVAPEIVSNDQISELSEQGVVVSLGHSFATEQQTNAGIRAGARMVTHLFNAMTALESRAPGMVGSILNHTRIPYGFIMDGIHVSKTAANIAYRANSNMILVSDAMAISGTELNEFEYFGEIIRKQNNCLRDKNNRLAGSLLTLMDAVRNAASMLAIDLMDAVKMATFKPASLLQKNTRPGKIEIGKPADFILLNKKTSILKVWRAGELLHD